MLYHSIALQLGEFLPSQARIFSLDIYRAIAVFLMVIFHFTYDLHHFGFSGIDTTKVAFWLNLRTFIVTMFMSAVGMSLYIVYARHFNLQKYKKRLILLGGASTIVSIATYIIFPKTWIYFGVLHMIFIASAIGPFFVKKPNISGVLGLMIIGLYLAGFRMTPLFELLQAPLHLPLRRTEDLASFVPWFGVVLLGIFIMHHQLMQKIKIPENKFTKKLAWVGQNTLAIYIIHQPVLFALLGPLAYFLHK